MQRFDFICFNCWHENHGFGTLAYAYIESKTFSPIGPDVRLKVVGENDKPICCPNCGCDSLRFDQEQVENSLLGNPFPRVFKIES